MNYVVGHCRRVKTTVGVANVARHNSREGIYTGRGEPRGELPEWISHPERAQLNYGDRCSGSEVLKRRRDRIAAAELGRKPQKNAAAAVEIVISASPEWFDPKHATQWMHYFDDALKWVGEKYGKENILHHAVHCDEKTPHLHVLLVPLTRNQEQRTRENGVTTDREMVKTKELRYSSNAFLGGRKGLRRFQDELAADVGAKYGLERGEKGSKARHTDQYEWSAKLKREAGDLAVARGALDFRSKDLDKREREITRREAEAKEDLRRAAEERATMEKLLKDLPGSTLARRVGQALYAVDKKFFPEFWKRADAIGEELRDRPNEATRPREPRGPQRGGRGG